MDTQTDRSLLEARTAYFESAGFAPDGGYDDPWVRIDLGKFALRFPNSDARRRAVRYHDLHHVVTGYGTDLQGEAEISAWEIASGCRDMMAAWLLNLLAFGHVLLRKPAPLYRAFLRGRTSRNLYDREYSDALLERSVGETRFELGLGIPHRGARGSDRLAFLGWSALAIGLAWGPILAAIAFLISLIR